MRVKVIGSGPIYDGTLEIVRKRGWTIAEEAPLDLTILANVRRILRPDEFGVPRLGTLCYHPSLLPRHRGGDAVYWTLEMGDTETGSTWFWIDEGIDTGPIAIQRAVAIPPGTSRGALYYGMLVPQGLELLDELLAQLEAGERPSTVQDESRATYEPLRDRAERSSA